ncbi:MAG: RNA polymerase sigma factor [Bacteroidota bacterium]
MEDYKGLLFKILRSFAQNTFDQDDLFQEISLQLWRSIPQFKGEALAKTWIYRVALNTAIKWKRDEGKHRSSLTHSEGLEYLIQKKQSPPNPRIAWLYEEIAQMNKIDISLCLLLLDGFNYAEMAQLLGISESHVGVKIHRIKQHLIQKSKAHVSSGI